MIHAAERLVLRTADGLRLDGIHLPAVDPGADGVIVLAHGFSGSWRSRRARGIAAILRRRAAVLSFDFRGHGRSEGYSTVGDREVLDLTAAVSWARRRGHRWIGVAGFSMGAAIAVRHAALCGGVDALAAVSGPAHWYYKGTSAMRRVHLAIETPAGRLVSRWALGTRVSGDGWPQPPATPEQCAAQLGPTPLLVVHGDADRYFPLRHGLAVFDAAAGPRRLWIEPGMGHAESATTPDLAHRLAGWLHTAATVGGV